MYLISLFGFLLLAFSVFMIVNPGKFADGVITFSEQKYFHPFEIISRIVAGGVFVVFSATTLFPGIFLLLGYALIGVGLGLLLTPPRLHKKFAIWSANRFRPWFRLIGIASIPLAALFVYAALGSLLQG